MSCILRSFQNLCRRQWLLVICGLLCISTGCHRSFYRRQADAEAQALISEKATNPHWDLDHHYSIVVDPRSRMFDPNNPDCPPLPPDDPTAHELMHCVDGKRGWPGWHDRGESTIVENPAWMDYMEFDEQGKLVIAADDAVRLGLINSRTYQQNLEELYLSALDVSFERFRFDAQGFAGYSTFYTADGPLRSGSGGNSSSLFQAATFSRGLRPVSVQKSFTTGSTLVVGLANSLVWQFSGPDDYRGNTLIDFALVQPVLRNAGRNRVMERLTVAERTLLNNVRAMEQYRQSFYVQIMTGRDAGTGPARRGGVFGSGLEGFTGVGGGFGNVNAANRGGGTASGGNGAGAGAVGGYLGLLQSQQEIRNQEDNVERLRTNLFNLEQVLVELKRRSGEAQLVPNILRQDLQVAQARQALFNAESRLLNARNTYESTLDGFKITLGLPPQLCLKVQDGILDQFQLIDRQLIEQQIELVGLTSEFGKIRYSIAEHIRTSTVPDETDPLKTKVVRVLEWYPELEKDLTDLKAALAPLREVRKSLLEQHLPRTQEDLDRMTGTVDRRKAFVDRLQKRIDELRKEPCPLLPVPNVNSEVFRTARLDGSILELRRLLEELTRKVTTDYETHLQQRESRIDTVLADGPTMTPAQLFSELYDGVLYPKLSAIVKPLPGPDEKVEDEVPDILVVLPADILALQLVQARARTESIELISVDMRFEHALEVARKYRRDWMNARATLVDAWRLIEFNADQLESTLDFFFSGDVANRTDNPFNLNSKTGRLRVGVQFDAPLTRLSERNTYRQSLIEYQQARRNFYAFEDGIARTLRGELRSLENNLINFELQRLAVLEAARQIDRNEDIRIESELSNQATGATAARDSVSALTDLLDAQNNFMSIWVNYESLRQSLDLDLGTLELDREGLWCDPGEIGPEYGKIDPWLRKEGSFVMPDGTELPWSENAEELPPSLLPKKPSTTPNPQDQELPIPQNEGLKLTPPRDEAPRLEVMPMDEKETSQARRDTNVRQASRATGPAKLSPMQIPRHLVPPPVVSE